MNPERELFDGRIADWLEGDPHVAPTQLVETVRAAIPSVAQRRRPLLPWRLTPAVRLAAAAVVAVLTAIVAAGPLNPFRQGVGGLPTSSPSATPGPSARADQPSTTLAPFTSALYGYTIGYPAAWRVKPAIRRLGRVEPPWADSDPVDYFVTDVSRGVDGPIGQLIVASADIGAATTLEAWTGDTANTVCGRPTRTERIELDGQPADLLTFGDGCYGLFHIWVTVVRGTTGTHIVWLDDPGREVADRSLFENILATFSFPADGRGSPTH